MTQDEIFEMARQADIRDSLEYDHMECNIESLEAFANLVAQRAWVGLTDEDDIDWDGGDLKSLVRAVEAKLKEKNT